ncbi:copper amine oxidase N-terminal domain-containing protein [Neglecta sp. X4]|jgi:hypothetical protein|nr:copper amine oxidase N-terminal domain-containing protein [Neglectibacter sp. 59]NBJ72827.1 copper amine oxidase N-terminal domain-containing protein [Neglectibacter sp. X4]NCE80711.1 copper amine oxidase N-terminal domain-containing protein [Neglectibacter sp. X58]
MNLNVYIETFLSWSLAGRTACVLFLIVFLLGLLVEKYLLRLLSFIPFLLDKLLRGLYILIEFPINVLHKKHGGIFYDMENGIVHATEKIDAGLTRWHTRWLHAKTSVLLVSALYLAAVLFVGVIPSLAGSMDAPIAKGGKLYLQLESKLVEQAEAHGWYTAPERIIQNSVFMKTNRTYILKKGQLEKLDSAPLFQDGRPYLPVRDTFSAFGGTLDWDSESQQAVIYLGGNEIRLSEESAEVSINGEKATLLSGLPTITADTKMYIDAQAFSALLGLHFYWRPAHNILLISSSIDHNFGPLTIQAVDERLSPYSKGTEIVPGL